MNLALLVALGVTLALTVFLVAYYLWVYARNRELGTPGIVSRTRLTCSKCGQSFDYDFIPGASFTAVRLGTSRYMACPLCHKWGIFNMLGARSPVTPRR